MHEVLERYEPIVDEFDAFAAAIERPLGKTVRVNTIKADVDRVREAFDEAGIDAEPTDWNPELLAVDTDGPGATWPAFHGWIHTQEAVSTLPPIALDPDPSDTVWDACAAPGSKTTQLAATMDDRGRIVANDRNMGRLSALRFNAERLGVTNAVVTNRDARNYSLDPLEVDAFDAALVDAPCSGEGTLRKNPAALETWSEGFLTDVSGVQTDILRRAIQATRPGGRVVYSTCTYAPEENEAVLDAVLEQEACRIVEQELPLESRPGVTEWQGDSFDPSVERAARVYPHLNDTGGFFLATLEVGR
ncbi:RNA methylase, NOL1/NOP2/sun family protein [Salinarchaeum sp. Harcht-Bsk1]|uniref:RsmB/NOP family class I SAM-dependent RNA methyltransferase n=1 Tax=Salinarchaeum sp. Harcht-Bsk1 TaxID=1333523 RepID=UPI0003422B3F|nr:RsmB/NOP family class I SAM-dependent RNA methyltransferase [Salinarchaeum sp. Harcht-Bsk1]AGN01743.1 RNA methylase, NOL1/NOP2/sun family protein [Salinarchaeum sp. Harcht-Bsk1]